MSGGATQERNIMKDLGGFSIVLKPRSITNSLRFLELSTMSAEKRDCIAKCDGQMWDNGKEMVEPCGTSMHTVSFAIILIMAPFQFE